MSRFITRGHQDGAIAQNDKELFRTYEHFCHYRHPRPVKMRQVILEEAIKGKMIDNGGCGDPEHCDPMYEEDHIEVTIGKSCPKCGNYILEGMYIK